jgi:hypothetical protein
MLIIDETAGGGHRWCEHVHDYDQYRDRHNRDEGHCFAQCRQADAASGRTRGWWSHHGRDDIHIDGDAVSGSCDQYRCSRGCEDGVVGGGRGCYWCSCCCLGREERGNSRTDGLKLKTLIDTEMLVDVSPLRELMHAGSADICLFQAQASLTKVTRFRHIAT